MALTALGRPAGNFSDHERRRSRTGAGTITSNTRKTRPPNAALIIGTPIISKAGIGNAPSIDTALSYLPIAVVIGHALRWDGLARTSITSLAQWTIPI